VVDPRRFKGRSRDLRLGSASHGQHGKTLNQASPRESALLKTIQQI
jgi:hypothetical protein